MIIKMNVIHHGIVAILAAQEAARGLLVMAMVHVVDSQQALHQEVYALAQEHRQL